MNKTISKSLQVWSFMRGKKSEHGSPKTLSAQLDTNINLWLKFRTSTVFCLAHTDRQTKFKQHILRFCFD